MFLLDSQALGEPVGDAVIRGAERDGMGKFVPQNLAEIERSRGALAGARAARAIIRPVLAPTVGSQGAPVVRTANSSCVGKTSMSVFTLG